MTARLWMKSAIVARKLGKGDEELQLPSALSACSVVTDDAAFPTNLGCCQP